MGLPYQLRCLGRPQLIAPSGEPVRFRVRKHLALLTYLALEPRGPHRRERLADMLWTNVPPNEGRHSVATAVSIIRGKLGRDSVEGDRDHLRFTPASFTVDLERLASGDILGDEFTPALEVGGFLVDFELPDAHEFMLWQERQRARWLPLVRDALVRLIDRCRRTGDFKQIERLGTSLLDIDELSEDGIRAKMEARAFDGDRLTALKVFQTWKIKLAEELQAVPSPLVEGIAIRLRRRDWEQSPPTNIPTVPTDQWRGRPFVGRAAEYRTIYEAWEKTAQRFPHHALVLGDSGVGKSTLLERVATAAGLEGAAISRVSCYELEREIPYAAVGSLIEGLLDRPGVSGTPPEWLAELARAVPQVRRRFPSIPDPVETQGETARIRLTEAVQQLLLAIVEEHPVILVIDDVHLADDASLAVLHLLIRRMHDERVMVLLAARAAELGQSPHAVRLRESHEPLRMQILELQPMNERECEELLSSLLPTDAPQPSAAARRALLQGGAGFPMVLEYLVKDWQSNGEQCLALSIGAMTEEPRTASGPSQTYRLILQRLAQGLDPAGRNVLNMAAVLGGRLNDIGLYTMADVSRGQAMMGLGRLTDLRILRDGGRGLEFCNELVRGEAYLAVPSPVRKTLHRSIAERLLERESQGEGIPGLEIAWHCIRAGRIEDATPYLLRGAREAIRQGAPHEAERALETGMGHLREPERTDATLLLAEALHEQGAWKAALDAIERCSISATDSRAAKALVLSIEPRRRLSLIVPETSEHLISELLSLAESSADTTTRAKAVTHAAYLLVYQPVAEYSTRIAKILDLLSTALLTDDDMAHLAVAKAIMLYQRRDMAAADRELERVGEQLRTRKLFTLAASSVHLARGNIKSNSGQYLEAVKHNLSAYEITIQLGNSHTSSRIASNLTLCECRLGNYAKAIEWSKIAMAKDPHFQTDAMPHCLYQGAVAHAMMGETHESIRLLKRLEEIAETVESPRLIQNSFLFLADAYAILGHRHEALSRASRVVFDSGDHQFFNSAGIYARWMVIAMHANNKGKEARTRLREFISKRTSYDRIDQTDILCANYWLNRKEGCPNASLTERLFQELSELPVAVSDQLRRGGFL